MPLKRWGWDNVIQYLNYSHISDFYKYNKELLQHSLKCSLTIIKYTHVISFKEQ